MSMRRGRGVNKEKEKVDANKEKRRTSGCNISPFPSNTLLTLPNLSASIQFECGRELALCIH